MYYKIIITLKDGRTRTTETFYAEDSMTTTGYGRIAVWVNKSSGDTVMYPVHQIIKIVEQAVE